MWFVLVFLGQEQKLRWVLRASWTWALALGLPCLLPPFRPPEPIGSWADAWAGGELSTVAGWIYHYGNLVHLSMLSPLGVGLLLRQILTLQGERQKQSLEVLVGILLLAAAGFTEYSRGPGLGSPATWPSR